MFFSPPPKTITSILKPGLGHGPASGIKVQGWTSTSGAFLVLWAYCLKLRQQGVPVASVIPLVKQNHCVRLLCVILASFQFVPTYSAIVMYWNEITCWKYVSCHFLCFRKTITALSFSPDGKYLVTGEVSVRREGTPCPLHFEAG